MNQNVAYPGQSQHRGLRFTAAELLVIAVVVCCFFQNIVALLAFNVEPSMAIPVLAAKDVLLFLGITYLSSSRPHIINMGVSLLQTVFLLASARQAFASCAHGTFLSPRAEDGSVKVNTFGYSGEIVSPPKLDLEARGLADQE